MGAIYNFFNKVFENVKKYPNKIAMKDKKRGYTYRELLGKAVFLMGELKSRGVSPGDRVGIIMENNADYVLCIVAILLNGGIFVPISCQYPSERIISIVKNCSPKVIITNSCYIDKVWGKIGDNAIEIMNISGFPLIEKKIDMENLLISAYLVYIIYTSGTTGVPKGVAIKWVSLENYIFDTNIRLGFDENAISLNMSSFSFDGALTGIFCMLTCGGTLVIAQSAIMRAKSFCDLIKEERITDLGCTPVQLLYLAEALENDFTADFKLKTIAVGGEDFTAENISRIYNCLPDVKILNRYGPTETTIVVSSYVIKRESISENKPIPIGKPILNTSFYAINEKGEKIKAGEVGELYVGGIQVMEGYWQDSELTERFIDKKLVLGERLYRTGDLVTIDDEGNYIFIDRIDDTIKLNGYRICLKEIDNVILKIQGVVGSYSIVVSMHKRKEIVSFVICRTGDELMNEYHIKKKIQFFLPNYMLPQRIIFLDKFPVTGNNKINKHELGKLACRLQMEK